MATNNALSDIVCMTASQSCGGLKFPSAFLQANMHSSQSSISENSSAASSFSSLTTCYSFDRKESYNNNTKKPHKANDKAWEAIAKMGSVSLEDFKLIRRVGSGDLGHVYLCEFRKCEGNLVYAMKVVDRQTLELKNKIHRADTERLVLQMLDHPFLPTLYAHFEASHFSCLVMEYCSGGDLHSLRVKQPLRRFGVRAVRFYAAEIVVALEYLHMMGVVYRDLKPENVLVREDGHIMLSDFDLAFICEKARPSMKAKISPERTLHGCTEPAGSCLFPSRGIKVVGSRNIPEMMTEPREARSKSFVGTHEYIAPEVIAGKGHGSAVDWWTFGIFLHEMLFGFTPFKGPDNASTLANIAKQPLKLPPEHSRRDIDTWEAARDLIGGLLRKDPRQRLGSTRGSSEVKSHRFFKGIRWALLRCSPPPQVPTLQLTTVFRHKDSSFQYF